MGITTEIRDGSAYAAIDGDLTIAAVESLREVLVPLLQSSLDVEIDLQAVEDIDTAGLQLMLMTKRGEDRNVRFVNHSDPVLRLLDLANVTRVLGDPLLCGNAADR